MESAAESAQRKDQLVAMMRKEQEHQVKLGMLMVNLGVASAEEVFPNGLKKPPPLLNARKKKGHRAAMVIAPEARAPEPLGPSPSPTDPTPTPKVMVVAPPPPPLVRAPPHPAIDTLRKKMLGSESEIAQRLHVLVASREKYLNAQHVHIPCMEEEEKVLRCYQRAKGIDVVPCYGAVQAFKKCSELVSEAFAAHFGKQ